MNNREQTSLPVNSNLWVELRDLKLPREGEGRPSRYVIPVPLGHTHYLLFQGLTGAIDIVEKEDYQRLFCAAEGMRIDGGTPRTIGGATCILPRDRILVERGYFLTAENESQLVIRLETKILENASREPMCFFLAPTNFCSVGCTYCIEAENPKSAKRVSLDSLQVNQAFDAMSSLMKEFGRASAYVLLFGGEPMQPYSLDTVTEILEQCRRTNLKLFCFTSGLALQRFIPTLDSYRDVLLGICITIDGRPEFHDSKRKIKHAFDLATEGIDLLLAHHLPTVIRTNVSRDQFDEIPWLRKFYEDCGWWDSELCSFELTIQTNHGNFPERDASCPTHAETATLFLDLLRRDPSYEKFRIIGLYSYLYYGAERLGLLQFNKDELGFHATVPKQFGCLSTGAFTFTLDADGSIRMCNEQVGSRDVPAGRFWPTFKLDKMQVQSWEKRTPDVISMCRECNHRFFCGGGCSLRAIRELNITEPNAGLWDLNIGNCGTLQSDFQQFFGSMAKEILVRHLPVANFPEASL